MIFIILVLCGINTAFDLAVTLRIRSRHLKQFLISLLSSPGHVSVKIKVNRSYNYPGIKFDLPCTPQDNFSCVSYCSFDPPICEKFVLKHLFLLCVNAWFPWQPIMRFSRMGCTYKINHISPSSYSRLLKLVPE